jgi:type I restriction enzyme S subunit
MQISGYENLKSSGSAWLGDIPTHWDTKKLKFLATVQPSNVDKKTVEGEEPVILCNYTDVYKNEYIDGRLEFMQASATEAEIKKFKVDIGDVIVTKDSETPDDIAVPACIAEEVEGLVCGYHLTQIKPINLHGPYLFRLFQSMGFNAQFVVSANGVTRFGLPQHAIANAFTPIPPIEEQQTIARFLDFKTAQIDALIAKKKALLDKLAEKRTALISHAVTKGLDPSVAMKESKVEWLGSIPQDWKETRVKFLGDLILGLTYSPDDVVSDGGTLVLRSSNVQEGKISLDDCVYVSCDIPKKVITKADDILICSRNGSRALIGKCALLTEEVSNQAFGAFMTVLRSRHARFLYYVLNSTLFKFQSGRFLTSTINQLTTQTLGDFEIALPPEETQAEIVNHLDKATAAIDAQCRKAQTIIDRLTEYRGALITNAVTGKIDVRDFAIPHIAEGIAS